MSEELKPCPFCGGLPEVDINSDYDSGTIIWYSIFCNHCGLHFTLPDKYKAREIWNTRAKASKVLTVDAWQILDDFLEGCESEQDIFDKLSSSIKTSAHWERAKAYLKMWKNHAALPTESKDERKDIKIEALENQLSYYVELEASICPEDYGFDEVIHSLTAQIAETGKALKLVMSWVNNWSPDFTYEPDWCNGDKMIIDEVIAKLPKAQASEGKE